MLRNVSPLAPIVVLATFSAVPVVVAIVLMTVTLFWVTLTVPPPVAVNAGVGARGQRHPAGEVDRRAGVAVQEDARRRCR